MLTWLSGGVRGESGHCFVADGETQFAVPVTRAYDAHGSVAATGLGWGHRRARLAVPSSLSERGGRRIRLRRGNPSQNKANRKASRRLEQIRQTEVVLCGRLSPFEYPQAKSPNGARRWRHHAFIGYATQTWPSTGCDSHLASELWRGRPPILGRI